MARSRKKRPIADAGARRRRGTIRLALVLGVLVAVNLYVFLWRDGSSIPDVMERAAIAGDPEAQAALERAAAGMAEATEAPADDPEPPAEPDKVVTGVVESGDSLGQILRREGLSTSQADELIRALNGKLDFRAIREGQKYEIRFDPSGALVSFEFVVSRVLSVRATRNEAGELEAERLQAKAEIVEQEIGGSIEGSLFMSMKRAGENTSLVAFFVDVFAYDLNFYIDTHAGDTYRMVVEKKYLEGEFIGYGRVLAAEYSGRAGTYRAFWWQEPGAKKGKYYSEDGHSLEKTFLKTPLKFARVSSKFNPRRMHPVLHVRRGHWGVDYAAPPGTPIWAAAPGKIVFRGRRGGAGNCVILKHDNGLQSVYMHMRKFRKGHKLGQRVRAKDVIGYVGSTGLATGPHLHFGVKKNGHYIDPLKMKMTRGRGVAKKHMDAFKRDSVPLVARLADIPALPPRPNPFLVRLTARDDDGTIAN